jgi:hypothetical protein
MQFFKSEPRVHVLNSGCCRIKLPKRWPSTINTGTLPKISVTHNRENTDFFSPFLFIYLGSVSAREMREILYITAGRVGIQILHRSLL